MQEVVDKLNKLDKYVKEMNKQKKTKISETDKSQAITLHGDVTTNSNNNNTINNDNKTVNIQLVAFGKEDTSKLTKLEILKILNKAYYSVPELVKMIHFDKNKPENHNLYISNDRSGLVIKYDGEKWITVDRMEAIRDLFDDGRNFLVNKLEELRESDPPIGERGQKMMNKFDCFDHDIDAYPEKKKEIYKELRCLLYNYGNMAAEKRKKQEKGLLN
jgi:hypothetical protein